MRENERTPDEIMELVEAAIADKTNNREIVLRVTADALRVAVTNIAALDEAIKAKNKLLDDYSSHLDSLRPFAELGWEALREEWWKDDDSESNYVICRRCEAIIYGQNNKRGSRVSWGDMPHDPTCDIESLIEKLNGKPNDGR